MNQNKYLPYILLVIAPLLWAGNFMTGRIMHGAIPPFTFAFYRWVLVILILCPFIAKELKTKWSFVREQIGLYIVLGFTGITCYTSFVYWSLNYTSLVNGSLINATVPASIMLISLIFFRNPISWRQLIGIGLSIVGVLFIILEGHLQDILQLRIDRGEVIMIVAVIAWSFYSILLKKVSREVTPFLVLFVAGIIGTIFLFFPFLYEILHHQVMHVSTASICGLLYTVIFASIASYSCWSVGIKEIGAARGGHFYNLLPVFGAILGVAFLGEKFHWYHAVGIILVFLGIFFATHNPKGKKFCASGCPYKMNH